MTVHLTIDLKAVLIGAAFFVLALAAAVPYAVSLADDGGEGPQAVFGTGFAYQGRLVDNGLPVEGTKTLRFTLRSDAVANTTVGTPIVRAVPVSNGLFTTVLDFGAGAMDGQQRWIDVEVETAPGVFAALGPRQEITPVPYAVMANHAFTANFATSAGSASFATTADTATTALNFPVHNHFGETWSGGSAFALSLQNTAAGGSGLNASTTASSSTSVQATNTGNCAFPGTYCYGVRGVATSSSFATGRGGIGVRGEGSNTGVWATGGLNGVYGDSTTGWGVAGVTTADGIEYSGVLGVGPKVGVRGEGNIGVVGEGSTGVVGESTGFGTGVRGEGNFGLFGEGDTIGVAGTGKTGVTGSALSAFGSQQHAGVYGWVGNVAGCATPTSTPAGFCVGTAGVSQLSAASVGVLGMGGRIGVWGYGTHWAGYFDGNLEYTGSLIPAPSDATRKSNIAPLQSGLATALALKPSVYSWNDPAPWDEQGRLHSGFIAQEVRAVFPSAVYEDSEGTLRLDYNELIPVLTLAIQEQQAQIEALKAELAALRSGIE